MKLVAGRPDDAGISDSAAELILKRAEEWVADGIHPSLVLLAARRGVVFFHEAFGVLTPQKGSQRLPKDAIFPLASITKTLTATAAMLLVEDGRLGLNRRVQEYIPEWVGNNKDQVRVHHLLTHTAGLPDDDRVFSTILERDEGGVETPPAGDTADPAIHRRLHLGLDIPLELEPGSEMQYSSYGIYLLAEIIRRITGQSLEGFASERMFDPLRMSDTHYTVPKGKWGRIPVRPAEALALEGFNVIEDYVEPSPSGGAYSTAMDMAIFSQMLLNGGTYDGVRILSPVTIRAMTRNQLPGISARMLGETFPEAGWGLGWSVNAAYKGKGYGEAMVSSSTFLHGGFGGVLLWIDPDLEIVGVYFSIQMGPPDGDEHLVNADLFMNMVAAAVEDPPR
ncbi:MAG: serine hydrolase domain-containing protein [Anaerolineales bacterium]